MLQSRHVIRSVEGVDLHWAEVGSGRPLVLLHGLSDSHRTWARVVPELSRTRRVLAPDLPGHGLSARPDATYSLDWYAHVMARWMEDLGLEDVDLVGHSFGGGVAQHMLLESRERIRRLALVAPGGLGREVGIWLRLLSITRLCERIGQPLMGPLTRISLRWVGAFDDEEIAWLSWSNAMPGTARGLSRTVRDVIDWRGQTRQFLDRVNEVAELPPLALFWGTRDPVIPIAHAEQTSGMLEGMAITRFDCGHFPHRERAGAFASSLGSFLDAPAFSPTRLRGHVVRAAPPRPSALQRAWRAVASAIRGVFTGSGRPSNAH